MLAHVADSLTLRGAVKAVYSACPVSSQAPLHLEMLELIAQVERQYGAAPTSTTLAAFFTAAASILVAVTANPQTAWLDLSLQILAMEGISPTALPQFARVSDEATLRQALWTAVTSAIPPPLAATLTAVLTLLTKAASQPQMTEL